MRGSNKFLLGFLALLVFSSSVFLWQSLTQSAQVVTKVGTTPFTFGTLTLNAHFATTAEARAQGLSGTSTLPPTDALVFVFPYEERWAFWMKDMQYPIDIVWLDSRGVVVHIAPNVAPETYPEKFVPSLPARYVIEVNAGVAATAGVVPGNQIDPQLFAGL